MNIKEEMQMMVAELNYHTSLYDKGEPVWSDKEWDDHYFRLAKFERITGLVLPESPTQNIHFTTVSKLEKVEHNHPMLSLAKTKSAKEIQDFIGGHDYIAMLKMDGLTCSLCYENGELVSAETRGNGAVGENILHNVCAMMSSVPHRIDYKDRLVVDGEVICTYKDFEAFSKDYKNPRNFASGSIRLLDSSEAVKRPLTFIAWDMIEGPVEESEKLTNKLDYLGRLGFSVVPYIAKPTGQRGGPTVESIEKIVAACRKGAEDDAFPIDGVVFKYNDTAYYQSLGNTGHHFRGGIAYKFYDETYETHLLDIEWTMGRTGTLCPTAVFEPVEIDGTTVERASMHNVSVMKETLHGYGKKNQTIYVAKMNMIIPQIMDADNDGTEDFHIPKVCPICGSPARVEITDNSLQLLCTNAECDGKFINQLDHFAGKKGLDIRGLSLATLEKLIEWGWIDSYIDIFNLKNHRAEWIKKDGFGAASVDNILEAIEASREVSLDKFIASIGIPLVGSRMAKVLVKFITSYEDFRNKVDCKFDFSKIDGFADAKTEAIWNFDYTDADAVYKELTITVEEQSTSSALAGQTICITGSLQVCKNRDELVKLIEEAGGKVSSSVSKKTNYLVNNDIESTSSKNLTAKNYGIPIITEQEILDKIKNI